MKICIDIDNTLLDYSNLFLKAAKIEKVELPANIISKEEIRDYLKKNNLERSWRKIQGCCYGNIYQDAHFFPGALSCMEIWKKNKIEIFLVSHKSNQSYCERYSKLKEKTWSLLESLGINKVISRSTVFFEDSLEEKITKIKAISPDIIIDDLEEVILAKDLKKIPFSFHFNKKQKKGLININQWENLSELVLYLEKDNISSLEIIDQKNNLVLKTNHQKIIKLFHRKDRFERELQHLELINTVSLNIPRIIDYSRKSSFIVMECIEGQHPPIFSSNVIYFLKDELKKIVTLKSPLYASHTKQSYQDHFDHLNQRQKKLPQDRSKILPFSNQILENLLTRTNNKSYSPSYKVLSLPDLGLHNILISKDGLKLIDFESSGIDDPVRTLMNMLFHSQHHLDFKEKTQLLDLFYELFPLSFNESFDKIADLVALEWLFIAKDVEISVEKAKLYLHNIEKEKYPFSLDSETRQYVSSRIKR